MLANNEFLPLSRQYNRISPAHKNNSSFNPGNPGANLHLNLSDNPNFSRVSIN